MSAFAPILVTVKLRPTRHLGGDPTKDLVIEGLFLESSAKTRSDRTPNSEYPRHYGKIR